MHVKRNRNSGARSVEEVCAGAKEPRRASLATPVRLLRCASEPSGRALSCGRKSVRCADNALWAFRLGTGRDSDCRVQPRQTDAVDQFVAREANGYKAEASRDREFLDQ